MSEGDGGETAKGSPIEGKYANYFQVGYNAFEFLLDFGQSYPEGEKEHIHSRIITSPAYALELSKVLRESIEQYEETFGAIPKNKCV
jgi:hypothetical protein